MLGSFIWHLYLQAKWHRLLLSPGGRRLHHPRPHAGRMALHLQQLSPRRLTNMPTFLFLSRCHLPRAVLAPTSRAYPAEPDGSPPHSTCANLAGTSSIGSAQSALLDHSRRAICPARSAVSEALSPSTLRLRSSSFYHPLCPPPSERGLLASKPGSVGLLLLLLFQGLGPPAYGLAWNIKTLGKSQRVITSRGTYFYSLG